MDSVMETKFKNLRRRLDLLGYHQPLGLESLPLVEKLFSDLIQTTESLKNMKLQLRDQQQQVHTRDEGIEPYKSDNAKLLNEVNQLHMELIRRKDVADAQVKKMKVVLRKLEQQNTDLRFLNTEYAHKMRVLEKENSSKVERITRLMEKNLQAVIQTPAGGKAPIATRRQRIEIKEFVPPSEHAAVFVEEVDEGLGLLHRSSSKKSNDQHAEFQTINFLKVADAKIELLEKTISELKEEKETVDSRFSILQSQVERREKEIERLGKLLEGGRPLTTVFAENKAVSDERKIAKLSNQVDFLQNHNKALQDDLVLAASHNEELVMKVTEMQVTNGRLKIDLDSLQKMADRLKDEHEYARKEIEKEFKKESLRLAKREEEVNSRMKELHTLEQAQHASLTHHKKEHQKEKLFAESTRSAIEKEIKKLEDKKLSLERSVRALEAMSHQLSKSSHSQPLQGTNNLEHEAAEYDYNNKKVADHFPVEKGVLEGLYSQIETLDKANAALQSLYRDVEQERNYFRAEVHALLNSSASSLKSSSKSSPRAHFQPAQDEVSELQGQIETLLVEKSNLTSLYAQVLTELDELRGAVPSPSLTADSVSLQIETVKAELAHELEERMRLEGTLRQTLDENTRVRELLREKEQQLEALSTTSDGLYGGSLAQPPLRPEFQALKDLLMKKDEEIGKLKLFIEELDRERDERQDRIDAQTEQIGALNSELDKILSQKDALENVLASQQGTTSDLRRDFARMNQEVLRLESKLEEEAGRYAHLHASFEQTEIKLAASEQNINNLLRENQALHGHLSKQSQEKAELERALKEYVDNMIAFEGLLKMKEQEKSDLLLSYRSLTLTNAEMQSRALAASDRAVDVQDQLVQRDVEIEALKNDKDFLGQRSNHQALQIQELSAKIQALEGNLAHLKKQLETLLQENEVLKTSLTATQQNSSRTEQVNSDVQQKLAVATQELGELKLRYEDLRSDYQKVSLSSSTEAARSQQLENMLRDERAKNALLESQQADS